MIRTFFVFTFVAVARCTFVDVAGCASLYRYDFSNAGDNAPKCFCDNATETSTDLVQINCVYRSTLKDLSESIRRIVKAKKILTAIYMEHMTFNSDGLPEDYFYQHKVTPNEISVTKCEGQLLLRNSTFRGLETNLTKLTIKDCSLTNLPWSSIKNLSSLRTLELSRCSIIRTINVNDLRAFSKLEYLDLSGNHIQNIDENSLKSLQNLKTLKLGPNNNFNSTIFVEINKSSLKNLLELDLSSNNISQLPKRILPSLQSLETLNLANNNVLVIKNETFLGLNRLRTLDIRVNLIHDVETNGFKDLNELQELYLAGNYLQEMNDDVLRNLPNLTILDAGYNNLPKLESKAFQHVSNLLELDLRKNDELSQLDDDALYGLTRLYYVNFSNTNISVLNSNLFKNTPNLHTLDVGNTQIHSLPKDVFVRIRNLSTLSLATTKLRTLPDGIFANLQELTELDLSGNNWNCDENLFWLSRFVVEKIRSNSTKFPSLPDVRCSDPDELRNVPLVRLYDSKFRLETTTKGVDLTTDSEWTIESNSSTTTTTNATNSTTASPITTKSSLINATVSESTNTDVNKEALGVVGRSSGKETLLSNEDKTKASIIITVVVVLAACITIAVVVGIVVTMKRRRRRRKSSRLAALKNFSPSSPIGIEMCQRPESNRLSDMDTVKDSSVTNQNCANPNLTPALYDEIMSQHEKDAQNNNNDVTNADDAEDEDTRKIQKNFRDSPLPPPPPPHL